MNELENYTESEVARMLVNSLKDIAQRRGELQSAERVIDKCDQLRRFYKNYESIEDDCGHILANAQEFLTNIIDSENEKHVIDNKIILEALETEAFKFEYYLVQFGCIER